jgi:Zn-finger nucleic acid-binding protein
MCPSCASPMASVCIDSHYGKEDLIIEQCSSCGNIWFDDLEFTRSKRGEASRIDHPFDETIYQTTSHSSHQSLRCPRDGQQLVPLAGLVIADALAIETCHTCHGVLMNRGEFTAYQQARQQSLSEKDKIRMQEMGIELTDEASLQAFNLLQHYKFSESYQLFNQEESTRNKSTWQAISDIAFRLLLAYFRKR